MTTLVLETGEGLPLANSYISVEEADEYLLTNRYFSDWEDYDEEDKGNILIRSSQLLDSYVDWFGYKTVDNSGLRWPRSGVYNIDGILIEDDEIPVQLKRAVAEFAFSQYTVDRQVESSSGGISHLKVDVIELTFDGGSTKQTFFTDGILVLLRGLGYPISGMRSVRVSRS